MIFTKETAKPEHIGCKVRWWFDPGKGPSHFGDGDKYGEGVLIEVYPFIKVRRLDTNLLWGVNKYELIEDEIPFISGFSTPYTTPYFCPLVSAETATKSIIKETLKKQSLMKTISNTLKRILSPAQQTLYKAGFINDCLELTSEGQNALVDHLRFEYEDALVKMAEEKLAEEKANETKQHEIHHD